MGSPTTRSKDLLTKLGYRVGIVEKWNQFARVKQDLFGIFDLVAIGKGETIGVQTTSADNVSHRLRKMEDAEHLDAVRDALSSGWRVQVHGWRLKGRRYIVRVVEARRIRDASEDLWQDVPFAQGGGEGGEEEGSRKPGRLRRYRRTPSEEAKGEVTHVREDPEGPQDCP